MSLVIYFSKAHDNGLE